jgi:hypothetical protein
MAEIDEFASSLLEEAKRFLEKTGGELSASAQAAYSHAALLLAFCSLEAHINAIADELAAVKDLSIHERAFLLERDVKLDQGAFVSDPNSLKMNRLEDRITFLHRRFSGQALDKGVSWWGEFKEAMDLRNKLTHPRDIPLIKPDTVKRAITAIIDALNALYLAIYKKKYPMAQIGLHSQLDF